MAKETVEDLAGRLAGLEARCQRLELEKAVLMEAVGELQQAAMAMANHTIRVVQSLGLGAVPPAAVGPPPAQRSAQQGAGSDGHTP